MGNPTRPVDDGLIDTGWGLDVADTVVRRYANAAARDADLGPATSPALTGQVAYLADTGAVVANAGPITQWGPPWAAPWGFLAWKVSTASVNAGSGSETVFDTLAYPRTAGRLVRIGGDFTLASWEAGQLRLDGVTRRVEGSGAAGGGHVGERGGTYQAVILVGATNPAYVANYGAVAVNIQGNVSPHFLWAEDVGPAANPTAIVAGPEGHPVVDVALLEPQYRALWTPDLEG